MNHRSLGEGGSLSGAAVVVTIYSPLEEWWLEERPGGSRVLVSGQG